MIEDTLYSFLNTHYDPSRPVLLGLSGGGDSLALLHLLLRYREQHPLNLHVAHINHQWRPESTDEMNQLERTITQLGLPWHVHTLDPSQLQGNLEAASREERLRFFRHICNTHGCQAVLLGHHAYDQAETVLKRIFEGQAIVSLGGLIPSTTLNGLKIWRPLLTTPRSDITKWLETHNLQGFVDPTNQDPRFTRGCFRTLLIPHLSQHFGKEVLEPLCRLGKEALELRSYLQNVLKPYFENVLEGPLGICLDLTKTQPSSSFEWKMLLKIFLEDKVPLSHAALETLYHLLKEGKANRRIVHGSKTLYIDRNRLFVPTKPISSELLPPYPENLRDGQYGCWKITVEHHPNVESLPPLKSTWQDAWQGHCEVALPVNNGYSLGIGYPSARISKGHILKHLWCDAHIPTFLREYIPVIWLKTEVVHEFLTGRWPLRPASNSPYLLIKMQFLDTN